MPRLFTAIEMPTPVANQLSFLQGGLPGAKWIDREGFHLTLRFIGDVDRRSAQNIAEQFERIRDHRLTLQLGNLNVFGKARPHALYAGVEFDRQLTELQAAHERVCQTAGLQPEGRKFTPHVTLARLRAARVPDIARYLSLRGGFRSEAFEVTRFVLLSSRDSIGGGPYVREAIYPLKEEPTINA